jgi:hypothetical protein
LKHADARALLARQIERARRALGLERALGLAVLPCLALAAWAALALLGGHAALPPLAQSLTAIAALLGLCALAFRAWRGWKKPTDTEGRARLEADSRLDLGAFESLEDQPAKLDADALTLWRLAQERAAAAAEKAEARPAQLNLDKADPWRLRFAAAAGLVIGVIVAGGAGFDRLAPAFVPDPGPLLGDGPMVIEAWASPAAYTGAAPAPLTDKIGQRVETPPSVEATVRVNGPMGAPKLVFEGQGGRREVIFKKAADGAWEAKLELPGAGVLKVVRFHTKAQWRIKPAPDAAPTALFTAIPKAEKEKTVLSWEAKDDFGVRSVRLEMQPMEKFEGLVGAKPVETLLDSPASEPREASDDVSINLEGHPYAGLDVQIRVVARDALGQEGRSEWTTMKLPEKIFLQPLARAAIEVRRTLLLEARAYAPLPDAAKRGPPATLTFYDPVWGDQKIPLQTDDQAPRFERAPAGVKRAARMIDGLTVFPGEDYYFLDPSVYLGLRTAHATLFNAARLEDTRPAADMLWEVALQAEFGDAADARKALENAQKALAEAIRRGASQEEIDRLTDVLRQAQKTYMQALVQEALREGKMAQSEEDSEQRNGQSMSREQIEEMLKEVQRLTEQGRTEEALALLDKLNQMMNNMEIQLTRGSGGEQMDEQERQMNETIEGLSDTMAEQRQLRDETQKEGQEQQGQQGQQDQQAAGDLAQRQEKLQRELEKAQRGMEGQKGEGQGQGRDQMGQENGQGEGQRQAQESLDRAQGAMGRAGKHLRDGEWSQAQRAQEDALRHMRDGAEALSRDALQTRQAKSGEEEQGERDPLGRSMGAVGGTGENVGVPDAVQKERAREILDELRRRAQDPRRPEQEREYLRRLLERFTGS